MPCFVCFLILPCNKKYLKNQSSQIALKIWYDFFSEFLRIIGAKITWRECTWWATHTRPRHTCLARPGVCWGPHGPPSFIPFVHILPSSPNQISIAFFPVFLLPNLRFSISLLGAPFLKLFWRIATWYVTPPLVQLVFSSSGLYFEYLAILGAAVDVLACWILKVK